GCLNPSCYLHRDSHLAPPRELDGNCDDLATVRWQGFSSLSH
ncbi:hypothetical protein CCACVL1_30374, partial [Corchorus capsularis]